MYELLFPDCFLPNFLAAVVVVVFLLFIRQTFPQQLNWLASWLSASHSPMEYAGVHKF